MVNLIYTTPTTLHAMIFSLFCRFLILNVHNLVTLWGYQNSRLLDMKELEEKLEELLMN